ncbi:hypothetical protein GCM10023333_30090 [Ferrimonas pelagia]|uniref:EAL domain-containing protein n=2 Tax=Ferrimonas pelagia TaxID=1177826 RepID=A0ABP9F655_9GAMM
MQPEALETTPTLSLQQQLLLLAEQNPQLQQCAQALQSWLEAHLPGCHMTLAAARDDRLVPLWSSAPNRAPADTELLHCLQRHDHAVLLGQFEISALLSPVHRAPQYPLPKSWMGILLKQHGRLLGALGLQSRHDEHFDIEQLHWLERLTGSLAQGLEPILCPAPARRCTQQQDLQVLCAITRLSQSSAPLDQLYPEFHRLISKLIRNDHGHLALLNSPEPLSFPYRSSRPEPGSTPDPFDPALTESLLQQGKPMLLRAEQLRQLNAHCQRPERAPPCLCWLGAPLYHGDELLGAVVLQDHQDPNGYDETQLTILDNLAQLLANLIGTRRTQQRLAQDQQALETTVQERTAELEREIQERRRIELQLRHDTLHDDLTGLPNRAMIMQRLHQVLALKQRQSDFNYALLYLDLNRFKVINDSLGHLTGDQLLRQVAERLNACLRGSDTVARLGGDEFAILLEHLSCPTDALHTAQRIHAALLKPYYIDGEAIYSGAAIGVTLGAPEYNEPTGLLRDADVAMYRAKETSQGAPLLFDSSMRDAALHRMKLENELQRALEQQQFEVHYQPVWRLKTEQLVGFEALVRWRHPERGLLYPAEFIELMQETHQLHSLDRWVLGHACQQFNHWQKKYPRLQRTGLSVNLSADWFDRSDALDIIMQALKAAQLPPQSLLLEITERSLLHNLDQATEILNQLRRTGIRLMMDDFGTGYSSLSHLHRLPLDVVKIDRSFISRMESDPRAEAVIEAIFSLGRSLGLKVNAEGIDSPKQIEKLRTMGCHYGQGFLLGHPLPAEQVSDFLAGKQPHISPKSS